MSKKIFLPFFTLAVAQTSIDFKIDTDLRPAFERHLVSNFFLDLILLHMA